MILLAILLNKDDPVIAEDHGNRRRAKTNLLTLAVEAFNLFHIIHELEFAE